MILYILSIFKITELEPNPTAEFIFEDLFLSTLDKNIKIYSNKDLAKTVFEENKNLKYLYEFSLSIKDIKYKRR